MRINKVFLFFCIIFFDLYANATPELEENPQYVLPATHALKSQLDTLFNNPWIFQSQETLDASGFVTLHKQPSGMRVIRHPELKGYLIKVYLDSDPQAQNVQWMIDRCKGAENVRNHIKDKKLKYFTVPEKWIYTLVNQKNVLVVTDMHVFSKEESKKAWKSRVTHKHLRELYSILNRGFASCYLPSNIPYTREGTFACVDTAYPIRTHDLNRVKSFLSDEMKLYWNKLISQKKGLNTELEIKEKITRYQLPEDHALRKTLLNLVTTKTIKNENHLRLAGFTILYKRHSGLYVVKHPSLPGYLLKLYLLSDEMAKEEIVRRLVARCEGAENVRKLIQEKKMKHFLVPDKWLFTLPNRPERLVLVVSDMNIVSVDASKRAWKTIITHEYLNELFEIIKAGYASSNLPQNIPYTRNGKFACIDTEHPKRKPRYELVKTYLSSSMATYWDQLISKSK